MLPKMMIESTLMARSTSAIAAASVGVGAVDHRSGCPRCRASTMPRPAGVNGMAVSSEAMSATKKAPLMPRRDVEAERLR